MSDDDDDKTTVTTPKEAGLVDKLVGDSDENGNLTERGVVVTETKPAED